MHSFADICNGCNEIQNNLYLEYDRDYNIEVGYVEKLHLYIANVEDCNKKPIRGYLFNMHRQIIETPLLEKITDSNDGLIGVIDNCKYQLIRQIENEQIVFKVKKISI